MHSANYSNYYGVHPGNTPANHPPTEARMTHSKQHRGCRVQDPWLPVVQNSRLFAQRGQRTVHLLWGSAHRALLLWRVHPERLDVCPLLKWPLGRPNPLATGSGQTPLLPGWSSSEFGEVCRGKHIHHHKNLEGMFLDSLDTFPPMNPDWMLPLRRLFVCIRVTSGWFVSVH